MEKSYSLLISYRNVNDLKPHPKNARTHSKRQIRQIKESIRVFGFTNPVLVDRKGRIIAGHGRVAAAKLLGMTEVPTICLENLTEEQIRAYIIADNKLAENAGWDKGILAIELQYLLTLDCVDFDVSVTGFEVAEIDSIIEEVQGISEEDPIPDPQLDSIPVSRLGDIWILGKNRILCGNALIEENFQTLLAHYRASVVITDPPYNVRIDRHATGNGRIHHREFSMASGEMNEAEFISFLDKIVSLLVRYSEVNALQYLFIDWRHVEQLIAVGRRNYAELLNLCVWVKNNGGMGSFYRSRHELILVFRNGPGPHRNNVQLGRFGRDRTNVWQYPGVQTFSKQGDEGNLLALHPTIKPVKLIADAILDSTARDEIVLDTFCGSGSTLIAAQRVGRICFGLEIDPIYVDVAIRRWQNYTGEAAVHAQTGKRFDEIAESKEVRNV